MFFSQAQRVFTVEHNLTSRSYMVSPNAYCVPEFLDSPVSDKSTMFRLMKRFRYTKCKCS